MALQKGNPKMTLSKLLWLVLGFCLIGSGSLSDGPNPDHLCTKVMSGNFASIRLQSIYQNYRQKYLVFIESDHEYRVNHAHIELGSLVLPDKYTNWWEGGYAEAAKKVHEADRANITSMYVLTSAKNGEKDFILLVGTSQEYWIELPAELRTIDQKTVIPFSIVSDGRVGKSYVINIDINTTDFVIYDLKTIKSGKPSHYSELNPPTDNSEFYYLQKTSSPDEILFVDRAKRDSREVDRSDRLFAEPNNLPVGFLHQSNMYLFDSWFGCVYVIEGVDKKLGNEEVGEGGDIVKRRYNVPFEQFFNCSTELYGESKVSWPASRCAHTNSRTLARVLGIEGPGFLYYLGMTILVVGGLVALFVAFALVRKRFIKWRKTTRKSKTSSISSRKRTLPPLSIIKQKSQKPVGKSAKSSSAKSSVTTKSSAKSTARTTSTTAKSRSKSQSKRSQKKRSKSVSISNKKKKKP